jgi:hypothetical protein
MLWQIFVGDSEEPVVMRTENYTKTHPLKSRVSAELCREMRAQN